MTIEAERSPALGVPSYRPLYALTKAVSAARDLPAIYEGALTALRDSLGVAKSSILLFDPDGVLRFKAWRNLSEAYRNAVEGHTPWSPDTQDPEPVLVGDVRREPDLEALRGVIEAEGIRALAFIPLVANGRLLGKFMLYYPEPHAFSEEELFLAQMAASQVAFAIDQHQARESLRLRRRQYSDLLAALSQAVYTTDAEGRIQLYNEAAVKLWGRRPEPGVDQWCGSWKIFAKDGTPVPLETCPMALTVKEDRIVDTEELCIERPDGSRVWVQPYPRPLRDASGTLIGAVNVLVDVTERNQAEAAREALVRELSEQSSILHTIEATAASLATELDLNRAVQTVTDAATRLTEAEFGAFFYNVVGPDNREFMLFTLSGADGKHFSHLPMPRVTELFAPTFRGDAPVRIDDVTRDPRFGRMAPHFGMPQGHLPVRGYLAVPVRAPSGEVIGGLFFGHSKPGGFTDRHEQLAVGLSQWAGIAIDNARRYEATLAAAEAVRESEARYRDIFESSPVSLWEEDFSAVEQRIEELRRQGVSDLGRHLAEHPELVDDLVRLVRVKDVNKETLRLFGARSKRQLLGSLTQIVTPEARDAFAREFIAFARGDTSITAETVLATLSGERIDVQVTVAWPQPGGADRVLVSLVDITARKQAEEEMHAANALKDQFLGLVSHELRTPISTIIANALILLRRGDVLSADDRTQSLQDIASEGEKLQRVIENLLLLTRIEASNQPDFELLSLAQLVGNQVDAFLRRKATRQIVMALDADESLVLGQPVLLSMVIENLLSNADKYSPVDAPVEIMLRAMDAELEVRVRDRGVGINEADLPNLFTPFYRTETARSYASGMGLGLAVSRRIVQAHGGRIWAERRHEGGTDFVLVLPLRK